MRFNREISEAIAVSALFKGVSQRVIDDIIEQSNDTVFTFNRGETVIGDATFERRVGIVINGEAALRKSKSELNIRILSSSDVFALESIYSLRNYHPVEVVALKSCKVLFIDKAIVFRLIMSEPTFAANFNAVMSETVYYLYSSVSVYTGGSAEQKLAKFLFENFGGYKTLELKESYSELAKALDMGRASLYRAFDSLIQSGAIEKEGRNIRLLNEEALKNIN